MVEDGTGPPIMEVLQLLSDPVKEEKSPSRSLVAVNGQTEDRKGEGEFTSSTNANEPSGLQWPRFIACSLSVLYPRSDSGVGALFSDS
jgi:hypothetical protein